MNEHHAMAAYAPAQPMAAPVHVLPARWRFLWVASFLLSFGVAAFALFVPRLSDDPQLALLGFALAALFGGFFVLMLFNPLATRIVRHDDGMTVEARGDATFIAWDQIVAVRDRSLMGHVELTAADDTIVRISHRTEDVAELLMPVLERVAPRAPTEFAGRVTTPAISLLLLFAIPASILWRDGVLTVAWIAAAGGLYGLATHLRAVRLTSSSIEFRRPLRRRVLPLRAILATRLAVPSGSGQIAALLLTRDEEVVAVDLPAGRALLFFGALDRELRRIHGDRWGQPEPPPSEEDADADIAAALAAFRERTAREGGEHDATS